MNYTMQYGLQPADRIIEPIFITGLTKHHAIYLGKDSHGTEWIAENYKFKGVRLIKAVDFFTSGKHFQVLKFKGSDYQRYAAVQRALTLLGKNYHLLDFNCEHYAAYVQTGTAKSDQVEAVQGIAQTAASIVIAICLLNLVFND